MKKAARTCPHFHIFISFTEAFTGERTVNVFVCPVILGTFATLVYF